MSELPIGRGEQRELDAAPCSSIAISRSGDDAARDGRRRPREATVAIMRLGRPCDDELIAKLARTHDALVR